MIKDSELRRSVKALVRAEVRFLVDPEQAERRAALLEALERLDERGLADIGHRWPSAKPRHTLQKQRW